MDFSKMDIAALRELQSSVATEIKSREKIVIQQAREKILAIANSVGVDIKTLVGNAANSKPVAKILYQDPQNPKNQWTGRGRQPNWVKAVLSSGKSLDHLRASPQV